MPRGKIGIGFMWNGSDEQLRWLAQAGVSDVVGHVVPKDRGPIWTYEAMLKQKNRLKSFGLNLSVFEGIPVSDRIKLGIEGRDEDLDNLPESFRNMGRAEIPVQCYNWMVHFNWLRTSVSTPVRGGAVATTYNHAEFERGPTAMPTGNNSCAPQNIAAARAPTMIPTRGKYRVARLSPSPLTSARPRPGNRV